jgi:hypothetical protein
MVIGKKFNKAGKFYDIFPSGLFRSMLLGRKREKGGSFGVFFQQKGGGVMGYVSSGVVFSL